MSLATELERPRPLCCCILIREVQTAFGATGRLLAETGQRASRIYGLQPSEMLAILHFWQFGEGYG